jgi:hypothetical protein
MITATMIHLMEPSHNQKMKPMRTRASPVVKAQHLVVRQMTTTAKTRATETNIETMGLWKTWKIPTHMKGKGEFPRCYHDYIHTRGVPSGLRHDNAIAEEQSAEVDKIHHHEVYIRDKFSEPYNQQQNPVESRAIRYLKEHVHVLLDHSGTSDAVWYHTAEYLHEIHGILSNSKHLPDGMPPTPTIPYRCHR